MDKERERIKREIFGNPKVIIQEQPKAPDEVNPKLLRMFPPERVERIMRKEARKYKEALKKKWDNWFRAVSK